MSVDLTNPEAVRREAERRRRLRDAGVRHFDGAEADGLEPVAPASELDEHGRRKREKAVQADVVRLFRAFRLFVNVLSQPRATMQTPGLPDLYIQADRIGLAWWWETKADDGEHSAEQLDFAARCAITGTGYGTGGRRDAEDYLIAIGLAERMADGTLEPVRYDAEGERRVA